ncbi:MAG: hypothetical protein IJD64_03630, partial [Clostridia bacterium]|nr:hypothetical protein [Clostridia bacterium]
EDADPYEFADKSLEQKSHPKLVGRYCPTSLFLRKPKSALPMRRQQISFCGSFLLVTFLF